MGLGLFVYAAVLLLLTYLFVRIAVQALGRQLARHGIELSTGRLGLFALRDFRLTGVKGPLRNLRCELVAWRKTDSSGNEHGHAWLPLAVDGVCLQLHTAHTDNQSKHGSKRRRLVPTKLVTWPISMGVQLATKLLPHVPVSVGNITLDFQDTGLQVKIAKVTLHSENVPTTANATKLQATLLVQQAGVYVTGQGAVLSCCSSINVSAVQVQVSVTTGRGLFGVGFSELDVRVGDVSVTSLADMVVALASQAGSSKPKGHNGKLPKQQVDPLPTLLQFIPDKAKISLSGIRLISSQQQQQQPPEGRSSLPAVTGHIGAFSMSCTGKLASESSSTPAKLLSLSASLGQVLLSAAGEAATLQTSQQQTSHIDSPADSACEEAVASVQPMAGGQSVAPAGLVVCLGKIALNADMFRQARPAGDQIVVDAAQQLTLSSTVDVHSAKARLHETGLQPLLLLLHGMLYQIHYARCSNKQSAPTISIDDQVIGSYQFGLPSPAASVSSLDGVQHNGTAAVAGGGGGGGSSASDTQGGQLPASAAGPSSGIDADSSTGMQWQLQLHTVNGVQVQVVAPDTVVRHALVTQQLDCMASGSTQSSSRGAAVQATATMQQLTLSSRPQSTPHSQSQMLPHASNQSMQQVVLLDKVECELTQQQQPPAAQDDPVRLGRVSVPEAVPTQASSRPLELLVTVGTLKVDATESAMQSLLASAAAVYLPAVQLPQVSTPMTRRSKMSTSKSRKLPISAVSVAVHSVAVTYRAPLPFVQELTQLSHTVRSKVAAIADVMAAVELTLEFVTLSTQLESKDMTASVQMCQLECSTHAPGRVGVLQCWQLLRTHGLELRKFSRSDMQLVKIATQKLHSSIDVDAVLCCLGMANGLLGVVASCLGIIHKHKHEFDSHAAQVQKDLTSQDIRPATAASTATAASEPSRVSIHATSSQYPLPPRSPTPVESPGKLPRAKKLPATTVEMRLLDVHVEAAVCESDRITLHMDLVKGSSWLEHSVVEQLVMQMNGRDLFVIQHLAVTYKGLEGAAGEPEGVHYQGYRASGDNCMEGYNGSTPPRGGSVSPDLSDRSTPHPHGPSASMESVRIYEGGGIQDAQSVHDSVPSASLGSRKPEAHKDVGSVNRQKARQQASRDRCQVPTPAAVASPSPRSMYYSSQEPTHNSSSSTGSGHPAEQPHAAVAEPSGILSLDVYAERIIFSIPYDEAPGRLTVVCELWGRAVAQVVGHHVCRMKDVLDQMKAHDSTQTPATRASVSQPAFKPAYVELVVLVKNAVFSVEHHPLESWMALHGPVMQSLVSQRHLTEQLLSSIAVNKRSRPRRVSTTDAPQSPGAAAGDTPLRKRDAGAPADESSVFCEAEGDDDEDDSSDDEAAVGDVLAAAMPSSAASAGLGAGPDVFDDSVEVDLAMQQAHKDLASMYKTKCADISASIKDPLHHHAALMHVHAGRVEGVVMICLPNTHNRNVAISNIVRLDPPSQGVNFDKVQAISLDAGLTDVTAHFAGVEQMSATIAGLNACGLLIRARQLTAQPQQELQTFRVGHWHAAGVPISVKGTRAPIKAYTDLKAEIDDCQGGFCPAMEAAFGQLNVAFKRLVAPNALNPDGTVIANTKPVLPWWDMMRYMCRGNIHVRIRGLTAMLATNSISPHVKPHEPRLVLTAATLSAGMVGGLVDVASTHMSAIAYGMGPDTGPGEPLLILPAFHLPMVTLAFHITPELPGGLHPQSHYAFPVLATPPPQGSQQEFVDVFTLMKCEGWSLGIDIAVGSDRTPGGRGGNAAGGSGGHGRQGSMSASGSPMAKHHHQGGSRFWKPPTIPHAYVGEFQVKYILDLVEVLAIPSPVIRICRRLRSFYGPPRSSPALRAGVVPMPLLKQKVDINLTADTFHIHHDAQDSDDPSDMVYIAMSSIRYSNSFLYSRFKRLVQRSNGARERDAMRQHMASLSVEAYDLRVIKPEDEWAVAMTATRGPATPGLRSSQDQLDRVKDLLAEPRGSPKHGSAYLRSFQDKSSSAAAAAAAATAANQAADGTSTPGFGRGLIVSAACFLLRQALPEPGSAPAAPSQVPEEKRPIRIIAQDVKILCPAALRDTCAILGIHMSQAFSGIRFGAQTAPRRVRTSQMTSSSSNPSTPTHADSAAQAQGTQSSRLSQGGVEALSTGSSFTEGMLSGGVLQRASIASASVLGPPGSALQTSATASTQGYSPKDEDTLLQLLLQQNQSEAGAAGGNSIAGTAHLPQRGSSDDVDGQESDSPMSSDAATEAAAAAAAAAGMSVDSDGSAAAAAMPATSKLIMDLCLLEYEIEFVQVQVNLVSDHAAGSIVCGTNSALLLGHFYPGRHERTVTFKMDQVQAHVVQRDLDPSFEPLWLEIINGKLTTPPGAEQMMRQVLLPFKCHLVSTKLSATAPRPRPRLNSQGQAVIRAQQELNVEVPVIGAHLDSRQFEILVDIIQNILSGPMPTFPASVRGLWQDPDGCSDEDDNGDVQLALETLQSIRERLRTLQHEELMARSFAAAFGGGDVSTTTSNYRSTGVFSLGLIGSAAVYGLGNVGSVLERIPSDSEHHGDLRAATEAMAMALAEGCSSSGGSSSAPASRTTSHVYVPGGRSGGVIYQGMPFVEVPGFGGKSEGWSVLAQHSSTLIRWANEQITGAQESIEASRLVLGLLRQEAALMHVRQRHSMSVSLRINTINWALSKGSSTIVQGELQGILYQTVRDQDHTGTTKIQLHTAYFTDPKQIAKSATASTGQAPHASEDQHQATESQAGVILSLWNPDQSWERDEMIRIYIIHGALEKKFVVYEHIEVLVHPIRVRLTAALAAALQDYFQLKDEDSRLQRQTDYTKSIQKAAKDADTRRRAVSEASPTSGVTTSGQSGGGRRSLFARRTSQTQATLEDTAASSAPPCIHVPANEWEVGSDVSRYSAGPGTAAASGHYASSSYGSPQEAGGNWLTGGNGENLSRTSGGASTTAGGVSRLRPMSADDATLTRYGALIKHRKVKSGISAPTTPRTSDGMTPLGGAQQGPARLIRFKHVRVNRMHARVTYDGQPISINDFGLVLDNRVYRNLEGGWRTVLNRYKWDVIKSIVKSATGWQARKLQELQIPAFGGADEAVVELHSSGGFKANLRSLLKIKDKKGRALAHQRSMPGGKDRGARRSADEFTPAEVGAQEGGNQDTEAGVTDVGVEGNDYVELMKEAARQKQRQHKVALLLGNVPPLVKVVVVTTDVPLAGAVHGLQ